MELMKLMQWLSAYPGFAGYRWEVDCLPHRAGMATLTPRGIQTKKEKEDLLGNRKATLEFLCTLAFSGTGKAQSLWDLQHWVAAQNPLEQGKVTVSLENGKHLTKNKLGLDLYTAQLKLTYEMYYEVNENGEN